MHYITWKSKISNLGILVLIGNFIVPRETPSSSSLETLPSLSADDFAVRLRILLLENDNQNLGMILWLPLKLEMNESELEMGFWAEKNGLLEANNVFGLIIVWLAVADAIGFSLLGFWSERTENFPLFWFFSLFFIFRVGVVIIYVMTRGSYVWSG